MSSCFAQNSLPLKIRVDDKHNKRLQKPTLGCLFESLIRKWFDFFETVSSTHLNLQFQLRSVREVCKDLNVMSSSLSADRVKYEPELTKGSYEQTRECIW